MNYMDYYKRCINFHRKYTDVKNDNSYWEAVTREGGQIAKEYNNYPFVVELLTAIICELERKAKKQRGVESK